MDERYLQKISHFALFRGIAPEHLPHMLGCLQCTIRSFPKSAYIIMDEEDIRYVGLILSGKVSMLKEDLYGHQSLLTYMTAGSLFGETFSLGANTVSRVSFQAMEPCEVLFMPLIKVLHVCSNSCSFHNRLIVNMFSMLADKNMQLMEKIDVVSRGTIRDKLLAYLANEATRQNNKKITLSLNKTELSEFLCINRSAMARELSALQKEDILEIHGNTYILK